MSEKLENQSKNENGKNNKDKANKKEQNNNTDKDQYLRDLDERLSKLEEEFLLDDYNKASNYHKNKLKEYVDQLDSGQKEEFKKQLEDYPHGENNYLQLEYNKKYEKVFKFSRFYQTVLNNSYLQKDSYFEYSGEKCRTVNNLTEKQLTREKIIANMQADIYEILKMNGFLISITLED